MTSTDPSPAAPLAAGAAPAAAERAAPAAAERAAPAAAERAAPATAAAAEPLRRSVSLGQTGEDLAVRYLIGQGMSVIERNWRCEHGEVDVVAVDGDCLVICEVKTRRSVAFGEPVEAVTHAKAARLRRLAAAYVRGHVNGYARVRVDVLGILFRAGKPPVVRHVRGVGS